MSEIEEGAPSGLEYNDGNLDARGVEPVDGPVLHPEGEPDSLDEDLDTSPRTDGHGHPAE